MKVTFCLKKKVVYILIVNGFPKGAERLDCFKNQAEAYILVTTNTSVENCCTLISTTQLRSSEEHLFSATLGACVLGDSLHCSVCSCQSL